MDVKKIFESVTDEELICILLLLDENEKKSKTLGSSIKYVTCVNTFQEFYVELRNGPDRFFNYYRFHHLMI